MYVYGESICAPHKQIVSCFHIIGTSDSFVMHLIKAKHNSPSCVSRSIVLLCSRIVDDDIERFHQECQRSYIMNRRYSFVGESLVDHQ